MDYIGNLELLLVPARYSDRVLTNFKRIEFRLLPLLVWITVGWQANSQFNDNDL
jgi:hypothetical protein